MIKLATWMAALAVLLIVAAALLERAGTPPRALGPYLERRAQGHNPMIEQAGNWAGRTLLALDRPDAGGAAGQPLQFTPQLGAPAAPGGRVTLVRSAEDAQKAIEAAQAGDVITFMPGTYAFSGGRGRIDARQAGSPGKEIVVRAERPGTVRLEFDLIEGFKVSGPYWTFENLSIRGTCKDHSACEHAFHIVGAARHFIARGNTLTDFNAQFKINAEGGAAPDEGLLAGNVISNSSVRRTANPVTPIDLVAASRWMIRGNRISDFIKGEGNQVSYGAFAKGAGEANRFEGNLVVCEHLLRGHPGSRVGLSLGGGGTDTGVCRDKRCITEQSGGVIAANLIAACSDSGIYLNKAAASVIRHNTLLDTGPLDVRFPESSADLDGNLVDSAVRSRDGGVLREADNRQTGMARLYTGQHPVRDLFADAPAFDLRWRGAVPRASNGQAGGQADGQAGVPDLCGGPRPAQPALGASEDYTRCLRAGR